MGFWAFAQLELDRQLERVELLGVLGLLALLVDVVDVVAVEQLVQHRSEWVELVIGHEELSF